MTKKIIPIVNYNVNNEINVSNANISTQLTNDDDCIIQQNTQIIRRKTLNVNITDTLTIGSDHPIVVQSMTNTDTENILDTVEQIISLVEHGSEIVRLTVNTLNAGNSIYEIKQRLLDKNINVPLVGDFHFNGHKILLESKTCAKVLDKYRINPGNVGRGIKKDQQFAQMINLAIEHNKAVRIGVNWGSLDQMVLAQMMDINSKQQQPKDVKIVMQEALISSALQSADAAIKLGLKEDKIIISCKVSQVPDLISVYKNLALQCPYPLHLGLTEAGMGLSGVVASSVGIANLLQMGIGDTIRVSITPKPNEARYQEVLVAKEILQALNIRNFMPSVVACPGCGRTSSDYFQHLALEIQDYIALNMPKWSIEYSGVENLKIAVMGCVVNGPGESKLANIGISLPGSGELPVAPVFVDGSKFITLKGDNIASEFKHIITEYIDINYKKLS